MVCPPRGHDFYRGAGGKIMLLLYRICGGIATGGWRKIAARGSLLPWGEGGALARRMRGKCPVVAPSSVTCGDSFPQRGKPYMRLPVGWRCRKIAGGACPAGEKPSPKGGSHICGLPVGRALPQNRGRGLPRPYRATYLYCPVGRGDPTPPGKSLPPWGKVARMRAG